MPMQQLSQLHQLPQLDPQVLTTPDGLTTTIFERDHLTSISAQRRTGAMTVTVDGRTIIEDSRSLGEAIRRMATSTRQERNGPTFRVDGETIPDPAILAIGMAIGAGLCALIGFPLVGWLARWTGRRTWRMAVESASATPPRLDRLEQAVESIAIEVERAAEAQRFSARLLSERLPDVTAALPVRSPVETRGMSGGRVPTPH